MDISIIKKGICKQYACPVRINNTKKEINDPLGASSKLQIYFINISQKLYFIKKVLSYSR